MRRSSASLATLRLARWRDFIAVCFGGFSGIVCRHFGLDWVLCGIAIVFVSIFVELIAQAIFDETVPFAEASGYEATQYARTTTFMFLCVLVLSALFVSRTSSFVYAAAPFAILLLYPYGVVIYIEQNPVGSGSRAPRSSPFYRQGTQVSFSQTPSKPRVNIFKVLHRLRDSKPESGAPLNSTWEALKRKGYLDD